MPNVLTRHVELGNGSTAPSASCVAARSSSRSTGIAGGQHVQERCWTRAR